MVKAGILSLKGDVCIFYCFTYTEGVLQQGTLFSQPYKILTKTMRTHKYLVIVAIEVEIIRLVKVRAYRRVRFGKVERVRSHYRCL